MGQFIWHLIYITTTCVVAIVVWQYRVDISTWWATTAEQRKAMAARLKQRINDIKER